MAKYFTISNGPRGCYMHERAYIVRCETRRELKSILESEADSLRDAGYIGANKRAVASLAAAAWRDAHSARPSAYDHVMGLQPAHVSRGNYCYGLMVGHSTRADYLAQFEDN